MSDELYGQPLPVNLHFTDHRTFALDVDSVMRKGIRMRLRRRAFGAGISAVAISAIGLGVSSLAPTASTHAPSASGSPVGNFEQTSIVKEYPPAGGHVTVLDTRAAAHGMSLSVVAWISGNTECAGAGDLASAGGSGTTVGCSGFPVGFGQGSEAANVPYGFAPQTDAKDDVPYIGFVRGAVSRVSLDFKGKQYQAGVIPVPGLQSSGAYVFWLPWIGSSISDKDISGFTAYGQDGRPVAIQMY